MWKTRRKHRRSSRARMRRSVRQTYTRADLFPNTIGDRRSVADHVRCVGFSDHAHAPFASDVGSLCDLHGIVGRSRGRPKPGPSLGITTHGITRDGLAYLRIGCRSIASVPPEFDGSVPGSFGSPAGGGGEDGIGASNAGEDKAGDSRAGDDSAGETSAGPAPSPPLSLRPG